MKLHFLEITIQIFWAIALVHSNPNDDSREHANWMNEYNTAYLSDAELQSARNIYKANRHFYRHFNRDDDDANQRFIIDLNQFGDKDRQYMRDNHHGYRRPENWGGYGGKNKQSIQTSIFPETLDWRRQGIVGPVVNQGRCGGSWAFTTAGIIESMTKIVKGQSHQLSPQELLDCNIDNYGCSGGFLDSALMYAISKKGLAKYADYQYQGVAGTCSADTLPHYGNITDYVTVASGSDDALMDALQYGPVGVSFDASLPSFQFYKSGIYSEPSCNVLEPNHWMMCVGYGEERGVKYWILKNSWGPRWGENGYIRVLRNGGNTCGLLTYGFQPIIS